MKVTIEYAAQVKRIAGVGSETVEIDSQSTVQAAIRQAAEIHGSEFRNIVLDSEGQLHPSILLFVGDEQVRWDQEFELQDGNVVTLLSPISGG